MIFRQAFDVLSNGDITPLGFSRAVHDVLELGKSIDVELLQYEIHDDRALTRRMGYVPGPLAIFGRVAPDQLEPAGTQLDVLGRLFVSHR